MSKAKKQRIVYKEDAKAKVAELEEFLFGTGGDPTCIFDREKEDGEETVAEFVKQTSRRGGLLHDSDLFFEDTRGDITSSSGSGSDDDGDDDQPDAMDVSDGGDGDGEEGVDAYADGAVSQSERSDSEDDDDDNDDEKKPAAVEDGGGGGRGRGRKVAQPGAPGAAGGAPGPLVPSSSGRSAPVWEDPDDATVRVDVAGSKRLRKLRTSEKQTTMEGVEYEAALRKQHQALNPRTSWAKKRTAASVGGSAEAGDEDEAEVAALLASAGGLVDRPMGRRLPPGQIETTRLKDANQHQSSEAVVQSVRFHLNGQLLLTAGLDKKLRLFQVDGLRNPLVQSIHLDDMPITQAEFAAAASATSASSNGNPDRVVMSGRRPHFYVYDMGAARVERVLGPAGCPLKSLERFAVSPPTCGPSSEPLLAFTGDGGFIPLVSLRSRQWVANLKMNGNVRALAFTQDGTELLSTGDDGCVQVWDLRTRRCRLAFADLGNVGDASSLALSPDGSYIATGSKSGVVNVYRRGEVEAAAARATGACGSGGLVSGRVSVAPARELLNLTTDVDTLVFSPDSQMLAMSSRMKRDSLRLVHLPSLTVFANWPTGRTPLHYVHCTDFSPHCGLLAIGNAKGRVLLYRLHHYQQA